MTEYTLSQWVMFFYIYCFFGWIWECLYVSVCERRWVNRGFLKGPFLPIYGSGAICILVVTIPFRGNVWLMALVGMAAATVLEYVTGYVMERLFRVRYWDYTGKLLNLNGYVCLMSTLCWGVMTVLMVDVFHVYVEELVLSVDEKYITLAVLVITPAISADFVTSFNAAIRLRDLLVQKERIYAELRKLAEKKDELEAELRELSGRADKAMDKAMDRAKDQVRQELNEIYMSVGAKKEKLRIVSSKSIRGLLKRNPSAVSRWHKESLTELKQNLLNKFEGFRGPEDLEQ